MNEQERTELAQLKEQQRRLAQELGLLSTQLTRLEQRLNQPASAAAPAAPPASAASPKPIIIPRRESPSEPHTPPPKTVPSPPPPIPPIIPQPRIVARTTGPAESAAPRSPAPPAPTPPEGLGLSPLGTAPPQGASAARLDQGAAPAGGSEKEFLKGRCTYCGGHLEFPASALGDTILCPHCAQSTVLAVASAPIPIPPPVMRPAASAAPTVAVAPPAKRPASAAKGSVEMRLGTYWAPRAGIILLLTGLVFFGNLAYQKLGPGGKVSLLYLASALLLGFGWWWQRKVAKESLKNYAQVLFAGGLAAVYFTTYAAYHVEPLRIIQSPSLDGILLLAWAGFMVWIADRKKSEVLALFAVGLAYYTSIITHVGMFTLYSNLVLTVAAVFFLVKNRWATLTFGSLAATYAAYTFWRFFDGSSWHWPPEEGIWTGTWFLMCYWLVFTAGVFLSKDQKFAGPNRAAFLTLNNSAFFTMFLLTMLQVHQGGFWKFSLTYGAVLLVLAVVARKVLADEPLASNYYLTQGLLLATVGFIAKYAGLKLALILGVESVTLLMTGYVRKSRILVIGAFISAALAVGWGIDGMKPSDAPDMYLGIGLGGLMLWNAIWASRQRVTTAGRLLRPQPSYFTVLALLTWLVATWNNTTFEHFPLVLVSEGLLLVFSIYLLKAPDISLFGQVYVLMAQAAWIYGAFSGASVPPWWNPVLMLALSLGFSRWWQTQTVLAVNSQTEPGWRFVAILPVLGKNLVLLAGVQTAVQMAGGWGLTPAPPFTPALYVPMGLGVMMLADALLAHRRAASSPGFALRPQPTYSTALALVVWLAVTWHFSTRETFPLLLMGEGLLLTLSFYLLGVPEITLLGQGYILLSQVAWGLNSFDAGSRPPWWNPVLLIGMTVAVSHWWQKQKALVLRSPVAQVWQALYALATVGVLCFWLGPKVDAPVWLALTSLLAIGLTVYGVLTRAWWLAAFGQILMLLSGIQFAWQLLQAKPIWHFPLAPIAALSLLSLGTVLWFRGKPEADARVRVPLLQIARFYRWVALVMSIWWVWDYIPARERIWLFALLGLEAFIFAGWRRNCEALLFSAAFTACGLLLFWLPLLNAPMVYFPNLLVIILLLAQRQTARRLPDRYPLPDAVHTTAILVGGLSLWRFSHLWVLEHQSGEFYLTACWAVLALGLFGTGIVLRERVYRWLGLGILACALGRVLIFDVWKLETAYRVLSFMALGMVLLVLGFIYNKYQEKIREWL